MYGTTIRLVVKLLLILIFFFAVFYLIYHYVGSHFEKAEHIQHRKNEEAVRSIEMMQKSTKDILTRNGDYYITRFELEEGKGYRIENLYIKFDFWDYDRRLFVVSIYCNEKPYDVVEKYFLGEGTSYNFNFDCPDWSGKNYFTVSIKPLLIRKEVRWLNQKTGHGINIPHSTTSTTESFKFIINPLPTKFIDVQTQGALNRNPVTYDLLLSVEVRVHKIEINK